MGVVPVDKVGKIEFYENHITPWNTNAVAIGTTVAAITDLQAKTVAARAAFNGQQAAQAAAKAATLTFNSAVDVLVAAGSEIIKQIKTKAASAGDSVYALAQIPAPAAPSPVPAPGMPFDFKAELGAAGTVTLTWKCNNPVGSTGTMYQVWRRIGGTGDFSYLGGSGTREFEDDTIPAGSSQVTYQIQAVRSTAVGPWAQYNVTFGVSSAGPVVESVVQGTPTKIAA